MVEKFFFIVGAPRSGTTVLQQALNRHSQVVIPPETRFLCLFGRGLSAQRRHVARINEDLGIALPLPHGRLSLHTKGRVFFQSLAEQYVSRIDRERDVLVGEKSPIHHRYLGQMRRLFPEAKVICVYRDGRDVALSLRKMPWMPRDLYVGFALWLHHWHIQRQQMQLNDGKSLFVRYESLVTQPDVELRRILTFLGLPFERKVADGCGNHLGVPNWEFAWKAQALQHISPGRIGVWRAELSEREKQHLEAWGKHALSSLNYPLSGVRRRAISPFFIAAVYLRAMMWRLARRDYYLDQDRSAPTVEPPCVTLAGPDCAILRAGGK